MCRRRVCRARIAAVQKGARIAFIGDRTVRKRDDAVGVCEFLQPLRHPDNGCPAGAQAFRGFQHARARRRVQHGGGFIKDDQRGLQGEA